MDSQDSSTYEDDHPPSSSATNHRRRQLSVTPDGSASSSYGSSSGSDNDLSQDDNRHQARNKRSSRAKDADEEDDSGHDEVDNDDTDDSFTEVNGKGHPRKGGKVPRTRRDEFKNLDADLYDLRRSGRSAAASRKIIRDDDEDEDEDEDDNQVDDDESEFDDDNSDSATQDEESEDSDSDYSYGGRKRKSHGSKKKGNKPAVKRARQASSERSSKRNTPRQSPSSESDDSDEEWGRSRKRSSGSRRRRTKRSGKNGDNEQGARYSSRGGQINYNEDDNDWGISSSDDEDKLPAYHVQAVQEEEGEVIESIHDFRRLEGAENDEQDEPRHNLEYLIKWKGKSHLHNTWETYSDLKQYKGAKKVDSYIQRFVYPEIQLKSDPNTMREEIEQSDVNRELMRDELKDYRTVERVISSRTGENGETEYFCKWLRLPYSAATWETEEVIAENHQAEVDAYLDRESSQKVPYRTAIYPKGQRPPFKRMLTQPEYLAGGQLRDYQLTGLNWMSRLWSRDENGILADEMGLGKTVQSISIISFLFHTHNLYGPYLVVVPLSTIGSWQREFERWAPDLNLIVYIGDAASRQTIRDYEFYQKGSTTKIRFNVLLTTFELVRMDRAELDKIKWTYLAIDEAHRLKNKQSQLHETLKDFHTTNRLLITGTPLQNSVKELIALCNFLMPDKFTDDDFEIEMGDAEQEAKIRDLHESLKPYMLRRLKKDVEKSLPKKTERILRVELSALQTHYYKNILTKNFAVLNKGVSGHGQLSLLNVAMELKKASNHPFLFPNAEIVSDRREDQLRGIIMNSGKMVLLDKLLTKLKKDGHRVLIFSQMVRMLDIMTDYLTLRGFAFQRLDGSVGSEARKRSIEHFNAPNSIDFVFLLSTRAGGLGINLETADTVIIFDSDWNPQNDLQAMARAHRIGQKNTVNVYRFVSKDTIEEDIIERAKRKMVLEYCIIKQMDTSGLEILQQKKAAETSTGFSKEELSAILKFGAQNMFQQTDSNNNKKLDEMDLDEILARAEDHDTTDAVNMAGGEEFLSQFQYADFGAGDMSWEEIIPADEREKFDAEERAKLEEQLYTPRNRSRVSYAEGRNTSASPEPEEEGRRKKRKASNNNHSSGLSGGAKKKRGAGMDPSELNTKDLRALARGMLKFGIVADRYQDVIAEAELEDKEEDVIKKEANDLIHACEDALGVPHDSYLDELFDDDDLPYARKNAKAVLFTYKELEKMNAGQMILRMKDLRAMNKRLKDTDLSKFRMNVPLKPVMNWTCSWGQKEDAMLVAGIFKHGFGAWDKIQEDSALGLAKKFFLSDAGDVKKIPKALHLVRRGEYLLKVLRESERDKLLRRSGASAAVAASSSTLPSSSKKGHRESSSGGRSSKPSSPATSKPNSGSRSRSSRAGRTSSHHASDSEDASSVGPHENATVSSKGLLRAVRSDLRTIRDSGKKSVDPSLIGECLGRIGREIERVIERSSPSLSTSSGGARRRSDRERERLSKQLWTFAGKMFPSPLHYEALRQGYEELKNAQNKSSAVSGGTAPSASIAGDGKGSTSKHDGSRGRSESNGHHRSRSNRGDDGGSPQRSHHHSHHRSGDRERDRSERDRERGRDRDRGDRSERERGDRPRRSSHDAPNGTEDASSNSRRRPSSPRRSMSEEDIDRKEPVSIDTKERRSRPRSRSDDEEDEEEGGPPTKRRNTGKDDETVAKDNNGSNAIDSPAASLSSPASSSSAMMVNGAPGLNDTAPATATGIKDSSSGRHAEDEEHARSRSKEQTGDHGKRRRDRSYDRRERSRSRDRSHDWSRERSRDRSGRSGRDRERERDRDRDRERERDRDRRDRDRDRSRDRDRERDRDRDRRRDRSRDRERERDRGDRRGRDRSRERSRERSRSRSRSRDRRYR